MMVSSFEAKRRALGKEKETEEVCLGVGWD